MAAESSFLEQKEMAERLKQDEEYAKAVARLKVLENEENLSTVEDFHENKVVHQALVHKSSEAANKDGQHQQMHIRKKSHINAATSNDVKSVGKYNEKGTSEDEVDPMFDQKGKLGTNFCKNSNRC